MPHTLVTGANGFVGVHIVRACIDAGHTVTGSVRNFSKGSELLSLHPEWEGQIDFVEIEDYAREGIWDEVFKKQDFDYVMHVAAPVLDNPTNTDYERDFLRPSVEGNKQLLQSAQKYGKNVKAIAVTGSINSITTGDPADLKSRVLTNDAWNSITTQQAIDSNNSFVRYCASKKAGEKAIWEFVETEKPNFAVTVFLPPLIFGPPIHVVKDLKNINFSTNCVYAIYNGSSDFVPPTMFPAYIDVHDLALLHLQAVTNTAAANKRFLVGQPLGFQQIADILKGLPELEGRLAKDGDGEPNLVFPRMDTGSLGTVFKGWQYRTKEDTFFEQARRLLELEAKLGK